MDVIIFSFLLVGFLLGLWRGFAKVIILVVSTYVPAVISIYYFDQISNFVDIVIANSGDKTTAALGTFGAVSGLISLVCIVVGVFVLSRFLMSLVGKRELSRFSRVSGGVVGLLSQNLAVTLIYFLMYTAIPTDTVAATQGATWIKVNRFFHEASYPLYRDAFAKRTAGFSESVASLGLANTLISGTGDFTLSDELLQRLRDPKINKMIAQASALATSLDVDALKQQLMVLESQNLTPEHIDQMIKAEEANRRAFVDEHLNVDGQ